MRILRLGCKAIGLAAFAFCIGMMCGMIFPIQVAIIIETLILLLVAYCCIFKF